MSSQCVERLNIHSMMMVTTKNDLCEEFKEFWKVEAVPETSEESVIIELFHDIEFVGLRYICKLPFRPNVEFLPDNYQLNKSRLIYLHKQFDHAPDLHSSYQKIIDEY